MPSAWRMLDETERIRLPARIAFDADRRCSEECALERPFERTVSQGRALWHRAPFLEDPKPLRLRATTRSRPWPFAIAARCSSPPRWPRRLRYQPVPPPTTLPETPTTRSFPSSAPPIPRSSSPIRLITHNLPV